MSVAITTGNLPAALVHACPSTGCSVCWFARQDEQSCAVSCSCVVAAIICCFQVLLLLPSAATISQSCICMLKDMEEADPAGAKKSQPGLHSLDQRWPGLAISDFRDSVHLVA